uniref:Putative conserved secreted protein n=1 Tax=Phlebotomus kandelakii TaxID=1109342 RepID=A0A6B2EC18_9DIPT
MHLKIALFWTLCGVLVKLNSAQETSSFDLEDEPRDQHRYVGYRTTIFHESATFANPTETEADTVDSAFTSADTSQRIDTTITENTDYPASETILQEALITSNELSLKNDTAGEDSEDFQDINGEENETVTLTADPTTITLPTTPSTTTTTTLHPSLKALNLRRKQKKQYRVYKSTGDGIVRSFLDDPYLRSPLAILTDTSPEPLRKAKLLWNATLRPASSIDLVLVAFNSSGISVTYNFKNTRTIMAGIESVRESLQPGSEDKAFIGILRASELIPYDSAIFLSTDKIPQNPEFSQEAAIVLLKKRIRLYLIWFSKQSQDDNESPHTVTGGILGEVALRTGGEIIHITDEAVEPNGNIGLVTLLLRNDLQGSHHFTLPIDTTAETSLHVKIHGKVDEATLETPNGG